MCGICGVVGGERERERSAVRRMIAALAHRGPDDLGEYVDGDAVLGNRRLAIIDTSAAGRQPLGTEDGELWITYNGEIYNHRELRRELEGLGHRFRSGTDTEVVLELYRRYGAGCLARLRGMFAFAVWNRSRRTLFAARDPFGQKPFFYVCRDGRFIFASEIKSILAHGDVAAEPALEAVDCYLSLRFVPPPLTMFRDVQKLPAGHWLEWGSRGVEVQRYWRPAFGEVGGRDEGEWHEELRRRIDEAVAEHLVSDVPVGAFLSGGLDSSVVVAAMSRLAPPGVQTFCVGSDVSHLDERHSARLMSVHCGTSHHESRVSRDVLGRIPWLVRCLDEPSDPISACVDAAARLAAGKVKVVLGGDGGDEVFAGFDRYAAYDRAARVAALPAWLRRRVLAPMLRAVPESIRYKSASQRLRWLSSVMTERGGLLYARMTTHFRFHPEAKQSLYGPALRGKAASRDVLDVIADPFENGPAESALDRMIYADLETRLPEHTLVLSDRLGMAYGLEIRSPLLDARLADFCFHMPPGLRIRRGVTKYALRQAVRQWLPPALLDRPKQGFMLPVGYWLAGAELERVARTLRRSELLRNGWLQGHAVETLLREHADGRADHHVRLWLLLSLDAWHRMYIAGEQIELENPDLSSRIEVA